MVQPTHEDDRKWGELMRQVQAKHPWRPMFPVSENYSMKMKNLHELQRATHDASTHRRSVVLVDTEQFDVDAGAHSAPQVRVIRCLEDPLAVVLDTMMIVSVHITFINTPLTFIWGGNAKHWQPRLLLLDVILDVLFAAHLLARLNMTCVDHKKRVEICHHWGILKCHFLSPFYWLLWASTSAYIWIYCLQWSFLVNNIKLVRGWHLVRKPDSFRRFQGGRARHTLGSIYTLMLASHWVACLMGAVGGYSDSLGNDPTAAMFRTHLKLGTQSHVIPGKVSLYLKAFVESMYMLTGALDNPLGGGGPREKSFGALMLVSIFGPIGIVIITLIIARMFRELELLNVLSTRHERNKAFISRALNILNIPEDLQRRVFSLHYYQKMTHDREALSTLFKKNHLSPPLECALRAYLYLDSVLCSKWFEDRDINYIIEVIRVLRDEVYIPGDYASRRGEVGHTMCFIARGILQVLVPDMKHPSKVEHAKAAKSLSKGHFFGQVSLIENCVRTAWVRADTWVLTSTLAKADIEPVWKFFPDERQRTIESVEATAREDAKRNAHRRWKVARSEAAAVAFLGRKQTITGTKSELVNTSEFNSWFWSSSHDQFVRVDSAGFSSDTTELSKEGARVAEPSGSFLSRDSTQCQPRNFLAKSIPSRSEGAVDTVHALQEQVKELALQQSAFQHTIAKALETRTQSKSVPTAMEQPWAPYDEAKPCQTLPSTPLPRRCLGLRANTQSRDSLAVPARAPQCHQLEPS